MGTSTNSTRNIIKNNKTTWSCQVGQFGGHCVKISSSVSHPRRHNPAHQGFCVARHHQDQLISNQRTDFVCSFCEEFLFAFYTPCIHTSCVHRPTSPPRECFHTTAVTKLGRHFVRTFVSVRFFFLFLTI